MRSPPQWGTELRAAYERILASMAEFVVPIHRRLLTDGCDPAWLAETLSKLNSANTAQWAEVEAWGKQWSGTAKARDMVRYYVMTFAVGQSLAAGRMAFHSALLMVEDDEAVADLGYRGWVLADETYGAAFKLMRDAESIKAQHASDATRIVEAQREEHARTFIPLYEAIVQERSRIQGQ